MQRQPLPWLWLLLILTTNPGKVNAEIVVPQSPPRGIETLGVEISGIDEDYGRYGLDEAKLAQQVAQQLEEAGFNVVAAETTQDSASIPLLQVHLNLVHSYFGYPYAISVKLVQKTRLADPQGSLIPVITWSTRRTGFLRIPEIPRLYEYTTAVVEQFIQATQPNR